MNYEDELERARARKSRKRQNQDGSSKDFRSGSDYESTTYRNGRSESDYGDDGYRNDGYGNGRSSEYDSGYRNGRDDSGYDDSSYRNSRGSGYDSDGYGSSREDTGYDSGSYGNGRNNSGYRSASEGSGRGNSDYEGAASRRNQGSGSAVSSAGQRSNGNGSASLKSGRSDSGYKSAAAGNGRGSSEYGSAVSRSGRSNSDYDNAASRSGRPGSSDTGSGRRSVKKDSAPDTRSRAGHSTKSGDTWSGSADPGSRAGRMGGSSGYGKGNNKKKKAGRTKKIIIGVIAGILAIVAAVVIGVLGYIRYNFNKANTGIDFDPEVVENQEIPQAARDHMEKGYWTIAVFGVDSRDNSLGAGNQSDVIMIVNLNRETGEIQLVSVFRDSYLNINDKNTYNKINAAYAQGGPEQAVKAINKNLDLNITHYATFNWKAVATAINILGGIDVDISKTEFYYINAFITETVKGTGIGSVQLKSAGLNHLDGVQAVAYARLRLMDTDYARTERQRLVVEKAFEKAKVADLATLNSLVGNMFAMTKTNIKDTDIYPLIKDVKKYHLGETLGFPMARDEKKVKIGSRNSDCVIPMTLESNVKSLHKFMFGVEDYSPTSTVQTISKKISDISGLYNEGKEIGHVATDKGYIPKKTAAATTAAPTTEAEDERVQTSKGESGSESSTAESSTAEHGNIIPGASSSGVPSGPADTSTSAGVYPSYPSYGYPSESSTEESRRPSSPADMATMETTEGFGPGSDPTTAPVTVPEATTGSPIYPGSESTSSIIVPQSTASPYSSPAGQTTAPVTAPTTAPVPAPTTAPISPGNSQGPAGAATSGAAEYPGAGM